MRLAFLSRLTLASHSLVDSELMTVTYQLPEHI